MICHPQFIVQHNVYAINAILDIANEPGSGGGAEIRTALQPAWTALGITADDIGTY